VFSGLEVRRNGVLASAAQFRTNGQLVRVLTGTSINTVEIRYTSQASAADDAYTVNSGQTLTVPAPGVLANDTPGVAGNSLTAILVTGPSHGSFTLNADGGFSYTPTAGFSGTDSATYQASDGQTTSGTATVTITVQSPYTVWQQLYFTAAELANPAVSSDTATPAGDGIPNLMKYALNIAPKTNGVGRLPVVSVTTSGSGNYLSLKYTQVISDTDISYVPEASGDLKTWDANSVSLVSTTNNPDGLTKTVVVQDVIPMNSSSRRFIRLTVIKR